VFDVEAALAPCRSELVAGVAVRDIPSFRFRGIYYGSMFQSLGVGMIMSVPRSPYGPTEEPHVEPLSPDQMATTLSQTSGSVLQLDFQLRIEYRAGLLTVVCKAFLVTNVSFSLLYGGNKAPKFRKIQAPKAPNTSLAGTPTQPWPSVSILPGYYH
jgi:hypothetical protein